MSILKNENFASVCYSSTSSGLVLFSGRVNYDEINKLKIVYLKIGEQRKIYLASKFIDYEELSDEEQKYNNITKKCMISYIDLFTNLVICQTDENQKSYDQGIDIEKIEDVRQYLLTNDMLKRDYSETDLKNLLSKIKTDSTIKGFKQKSKAM